MARKRIRIDLEDDDGAKYDIKIEGNVTREKVLKIFEMMNLMNLEDGGEKPKKPLNMDSTGAKIWHTVDKYFPVGEFTSTLVLEKYEDEFNEPIKLSIISTYLSRFSTRGRVGRTRTGREWTYQTIKINQKHPPH